MLSRFRTPVAVIAAALAVAMAIAVLVVSRGAGGTRLTVYFSQAVGVYAGSDVRVLGVKAGRVDSVRAEGTRVRAVMTVDHGVDVPAAAKAVAVAPSLVADRYVQLTPVYTGGPRLAAGATIPVERTATPMELDQVYANIEKLAADLGPNGLNKDGAVSGLLETGAANLKGNGQDIRSTTQALAQAARTMAGSQKDLFGTVRNLQTFTTMLKENDGQVRLAERQLADVSGFLAADRHELDAALKALADALVKVKDFIQDNRALVRENVEKLAKITQVLADQRRSLAEALDVQPLNATNVLNAYDPATRTLMGRGNLNELSMPLPVTGGQVAGSSAGAGQGGGR